MNFSLFWALHFIDKSIEVYIYSKSNDSFVDIWGFATGIGPPHLDIPSYLLKY